MPPENVRAFATITHEGADATALVSGYQLPTPTRARNDVAGKYINYPRYGKLQPMTFSMTVTSAKAKFLAGIGKEYSIEVVEDLETPGQPTVQMTAEITGDLESPAPGNYNVGADEVRDITLTYGVKKYKLIEGGETVWDIDIETDTYKQNGEDIFDLPSSGG